jgi:hypothetical protein
MGFFLPGRNANTEFCFNQISIRPSTTALDRTRRSGINGPASMRPQHTTARDGGSADFAGAKICQAILAIHCSRASMRPQHTTARDGGSADFAGAKICQAILAIHCSRASMRPQHTSHPGYKKGPYGPLKVTTLLMLLFPD